MEPQINYEAKLGLFLARFYLWLAQKGLAGYEKLWAYLNK